MTKIKKIKKKKYLEPVSMRPEVLIQVDKGDLMALEYTDLVELGKEVVEIKFYTQWLLGKIGDAVSKKRNDIKNFVDDMGLGIKLGSMYQYISVYRAYTSEDPNFTPDVYHGSIPWGMLQYVSTSSSEPIKKLNKLIDEGVRSIDGTVRAIKTEESGIVIPYKPKATFRWDTKKSKWVLFIKAKDWGVIDWSEVEKEMTLALGKTL